MYSSPPAGSPDRIPQFGTAVSACVFSIKRVAGLGEVCEDVVLLLTQGRDRRQDAGHKSAARRALRAEGFPPPQDRPA